MAVEAVKSDFQKIHASKKLVSIEWVFGQIIFVLKQFTLTEIILNLSRWPSRRQYQFVDCYMIGTTVLLAAVLVCWSSWWPLRCLAYYILAGSIINMANVVFLTKGFRDPISDGRTLLLFIFNVVQVLLTFAIWYASKGVPTPFFWAVMVFGTVARPEKMGVDHVVAAQIGTDFFLLAIYLAFAVGALRRPVATND
jgi:hypothetical protein